MTWRDFMERSDCMTWSDCKTWSVLAICPQNLISVRKENPKLSKLQAATLHRHIY